MKSPNHKNVFVDGAISPDFVAHSIAKHQSKTEIGAHNIFLGQVRADSIDNQKVIAIDYSAYEEMANKTFHEIREKALAKFDLTCMHIYHSRGLVRLGGICLFVFVSSARRKFIFDALSYVVEEVKVKVPVFGKEILENQRHQWKVNN